MGGPTLEDGTFEIRNIPNGKYDLMVMVVGYRRFQQPVEIQDSKYTLDIALRQDTINLSAVTVYADQSDRKFYPDFEKYFLGETKNGKQCKIINPETLHFYYDRKASFLTVHASSTLVVENKALGYRMHYVLDRFELDYKTATKVIEGVQRFEELPYASRRDSISRARKRRESYRGSLNHFMRSLYSNTLNEQEFLVSVADSVNHSDYPYHIGELHSINLAEHVTGYPVKSFLFKGVLKVEYQGEYEPWEYRHGRGDSRQTSFIKFKRNSISIFENGYYADQLSIFLEGYLVWAETVGDMLPLSYYPPPKRKKK